MNETTLDRFRGCLVGLAIGDALGAPVEFAKRGSFPTVYDYRDGGRHRLKAGQWTDDTSMAICLAESLIEKRLCDPKDQLDRYCRWWRHGENSVTGHCFDIGATTAMAIRDYEVARVQDELVLESAYSDERYAGNGSIMRIAPIPMAYYQLIPAIEAAVVSSKTTHSAQECLDACVLLTRILHYCLRREDDPVSLKEIIYSCTKDSPNRWSEWTEKGRAVSSVRSTGYVVDTLDAALWCCCNSSSFVEAVCKAVNLGDDADTVGAVTGQIAGAYYGLNSFPKYLVDNLAEVDRLIRISEELANLKLVYVS